MHSIHLLKALDNFKILINLGAMERINLFGNTVADLENVMLEIGEKPYRAKQLFKWFYKLGEHEFERMTDLSRDLRQLLTDKFSFIGMVPEKTLVSSDGSEKFLYRLTDDSLIESVLLKDGDKRTVCVSSQVGCPLGCTFCATGMMGFKRNLSTAEIVGQLVFLRRRDGDDAFGNIVFMGMGEPLLNFENLVRTVGIISSGIGLSISARKVTVSTVGIVPEIYRLADTKLKVNLAISLHAANDDKRRKIIPVAKKYPLVKLTEAAKYFAHKRKNRITFEYVLIGDFNDGDEDIRELSRLVRGIPCKINILSYNPVEGLPYRRPTEDEINRFAQELYPHAPAVTVRKSRGLDISGACGQLAGKYIN